VKTARAMGGAGLMIVEAPMGVGKTEAALLAAEVLAHDSGANGCFVALPTQATTDAMFGRVRSWLDRIPGGATLTLAHGKAHLNDEYRGLARRGHIDESCGAVAHDWLRGRKKAGLAGFVVGTIDQVLLAGLKSRHVMLRHLALAGKVVIIDEVHAYDVYMSQYLHRVMEWLGAYRVPVILLSATLPDARRAELLAAYDSTAPRVQTPGYPAITATNIEPQTLPLPDRTVSVAVDRLGDDLDAVKSYLREHLADGGCAVVVRNTVRRVQETADHLADEFEVTINHARFLACDRAEIDRELLRRFGPPTTAQGRPRRHVVVASQVVEQSLDIDFDVMVTDLAPMDLLLQRMGRLHRHDRPDRAMRARCAVTGADWSTTPPTPVRGSTFVYDPHHLLRAAALLNGVEELSLPQDIARLVQDAYGDDRLGPESWQPVMGLARDQAAERARKRGASARTYLLPRPSNDSLVGWLSASADEVDEDHHRSVAQVRDGADSLEVLVVQHDTDGGLRTPDWVKGGGQQIPIIGGELPWPLVRVISACSLRLPHALCHEGVIDAVIRELEDGWRVSSFEETRALKGQLVLAFDDDRTAELQGYRLTYDPTRGLLHERI
jgi:CRISPR-associated endonuclease/helicase Cas3